MLFTGKRLRVLVVDDDADICKWVETTLGQLGHKVFIASCVHEAIQILRSLSFDLVVSDLRMEGDDGIDLLTHLRRINWTSPKFILFTSHADLPREMALDLGANDVLGKPCSERELVDAIHLAFKDIHSAEDDSKAQREKKVRVCVALDADLSIEGDVSARVGKVLNVAQGGMFLCLEHTQPPVNALVHLKVRFPSTGGGSGAVFQARGLVRWSRPLAGKGQPTGFGIQFLDLSPRDADLLEKFVQSERHQEMPKLEGGAARKKTA